MNLERPERKDGSRLCIAVTAQGVTVYANKEALESLAEAMTWIASSKAEEHYECHTLFSLQDEDSLFGKKDVKNAYVLIEKPLRGLISEARGGEVGFELTFMIATDADLDSLDACQSSGLLPDSSHRDVI